MNIHAELDNHDQLALSIITKYFIGSISIFLLLHLSFDPMIFFFSLFFFKRISINVLNLFANCILGAARTHKIKQNGALFFKLKIDNFERFFSENCFWKNNFFK